MATAWVTFPIEFKGGLISNMSELQQGAQLVGSATTLQNFEPSKEGGYKKILGYIKFSNSVVPGTGVITGVKVINNTEVLAIRTSGGVSKVYHSSGGAWTLKATAALNGGKSQFVEYNYTGVPKIAFVDGVNFPAIYNGSTVTVSYLTTPVEMQGASEVTAYKNAIFYSKGSLLYFTAPFTDNDFNTGAGAGVINIGHIITGLVVFRNQLIVFSTNKVQRITGSDSLTFDLSPITDSLGCLDGNTIQEVGGDIMYLAPDGLRLLSATDRIGDFGLDVASSPIERDMRQFTSGSSEFTSLVIREKAQYRIFSYKSSEQASLAKGIIATKFSDQGASSISFAKCVGFKAYTCDSKYTDSDETIVFVNEDGYVYYMERGYTFDGQPIQAIYESPYMPITDPRLRKTFYRLTTYLEPTGNLNLSLNLKYDFGRNKGFDVLQPPTDTVQSTSGAISFYGTATYGTDTYGGTLDKVYTTPIIGSGKTIAIRLEDNTTNPSFSMDTAVLEYMTNDRQ